MHNIKILKTNSIYRLTDLVFCRGIRWEQDQKTILTDPLFRNTVLYTYLSHKKHDIDLKAFKFAVKKHQKKYERPSSDSLIVHLRLGDILDDYDESRCYEKCKEIYTELELKSLPKLNKVTIVTALHFGANPLNNKYFYSNQARDRSFELLQLVSEELKGKGLDVYYKSTENVDEDICFMSGSKYFLKSLSGLSDLVVNCLDYGSIVWAPDSHQFYKKTRLNSFKDKIKRFLKAL